MRISRIQELKKLITELAYMRQDWRAVVGLSSKIVMTGTLTIFASDTPKWSGLHDRLSF